MSVEYSLDANMMSHDEDVAKQYTIDNVFHIIQFKTSQVHNQTFKCNFYDQTYISR